MKKYIPAEVEKKSQAKWKKNFKPVDLANPKKKYYMLVEFTYPSGDLHMGHWFAFAVPDILARYKKMQGYNVFAPNGFDAFGLPAENAAIKHGIHPKDWTFDNIEKMRKQFDTMGAIYDWGHSVITCEPDYYRWNQWIFLKMFEKGLAYKGKVLSNWCPVDKTVLANENVENGKCWRCGTEVVQKEVEQWFFKITEYAEKLLWPQDEVEPRLRGSTSFKVDWPKPVREAQNNWIGKSEGIEIDFTVDSSQLTVDGSKKSVNREPLTDNKLTVYTKFPETIYGVTYMVLAPEHPLVPKLATKEQKKEVEEYINMAQKKSELERTSLDKDKTGVFTGSYVINPVNGEKVPVWLADYVVATYGTGAVMGVPGSDHRDFEFAKKYDLPIVRVIGSIPGDQSPAASDKDVLEEGYLVNSGKFDGMGTPEPAKEKMMEYLSEKGWGRRQVNYHLHDWSISRQRYWGTPIPTIYCANCWEVKSEKLKVKSVEGKDYSVIDGKKQAIVPVPYDQLPVELPYDVDFAPKGKPPLATAEKWVKVKCPKCGGEAKREVETMDTFVDSSWYFLRYLREVSENSENSVNQKVGKSEKSDKSDKQSLRSSPAMQDAGLSLKIRHTESSEYSGKLPWNSDYVRDWLPIDIYFGGAEHTLGHTLYSRFFFKFLQDIGAVPEMVPTSPRRAGLRGASEYAKKRVHHGVILGPDGARMSKSHGNVVNPDDEVKKYGADAVRMYLAFLGPYDLVAPWDPGGIGGVYHFLERVWKLAESISENSENSVNQKIQKVRKPEKSDSDLTDTTELPNHRHTESSEYSELTEEDLYWMHKSIKKVGEDIEGIKFNTGVSTLMEWINHLSKKAHKGNVSKVSNGTKVSKGEKNSKTLIPFSYEKETSETFVTLLEYKTLLLLLAPYAPHICEELWEMIHEEGSKGPKEPKGPKAEKTFGSSGSSATVGSIHDEPWPKYDPKYVQSKTITLVVSVNGKVRDKLEVAVGISQKDAEKLALSSEKVQGFVGGKSPRKVIFVPDRLLNIVV